MGRYEEQQNTTTGTLTKGAPAQQDTTTRLTSIDTYMANANTPTNNQRTDSNIKADAILNHIVTSRLLTAMQGKNIPIDLTGMPTDDPDKNVDPETVRTLLRKGLKDQRIAVVKGDKTNELYPGLGLALDPRYAQRSQNEVDYRINDQHKPVSMSWLPKHYLDPLTEPANPPAAAPKPKAQNIPPVTQTRQPSGNTPDIHLEITPVNPPANQKPSPANPPSINPNNRPQANNTPAPDPLVQNRSTQHSAGATPTAPGRRASTPRTQTSAPRRTSGGTMLQVPFVPQGGFDHPSNSKNQGCGKASQQMILYYEFAKLGHGNYYKAKLGGKAPGAGLSLTHINNMLVELAQLKYKDEHGNGAVPKKTKGQWLDYLGFEYKSSGMNSDLSPVKASLDNKHAVITYTNLYSGIHIIPLVGYDDKYFYANDTFTSKTREHVNTKRIYPRTLWISNFRPDTRGGLLHEQTSNQYFLYAVPRGRNRW